MNQQGNPATPDLGKYRSKFPILERKVYLNSNSLGALSRRSMDEHREFERLWNEMGASAWYELWVAKLDKARADVETRMRRTGRLGGKAGE